MKSIKAYSLTAFALAIIVVVTGFVHPGGYSAQAAQKVVLCSIEEQNICPNEANILPVRTPIKSQSGYLSISGTLNVSCPELLFRGHTTPRMSSNLQWVINFVSANCEMPCQVVKTPNLPLPGIITAENGAPMDTYWFTLTVVFKIACEDNHICVFSSSPKVEVIFPSGGLPKISILEAKLALAFGDPAFCGENNTWSDVFRMEGDTGVSFSLFGLTSKETEEQEAEEEHEEELHGKEWHEEELELEKEYEQNITAFCNEDPGKGAAEICPEEESVTHVHEVTQSGKKAKLLSSVLNVECDVLFLGETVAEAGDPLQVTGSFTYSNCSGSCTVTEENAPAEVQVSKTGHESANIVGEFLFHVNCGGFVNCRYNGEGLEWTAKGPLLSSETNGEIALKEQVANKESGLLCPSTAKLDITLTPLSALYITSW